MEDSRAILKPSLALCLERIKMEGSALSSELELAEVVKSLEGNRKKWLHAELELKKYKELLVKSDVAKAALEVQLKHARNQVDVEIKKRYKIESDYQYLQRQMRVMCDILVHDSKSNACLNDEQKSLLATFDPKGANVTLHKSKRLSVIDESSFLSHSDISYDRTDDDLDLDTTLIKPLRSRARERRRSSMGPAVFSAAVKRGRLGNSPGDLGSKAVEKEVETIVKASVTTPESTGPIHMVIDITQEAPEKILSEDHRNLVADQTSVWGSHDDAVAEPSVFPEPEPPSIVQPPFYTPIAEKPPRHVFFSKTVIRPETCVPCGKRIRFGKMAVKCRDCRVVAHPECKPKCLGGCSPSTTPSAHGPGDTLEHFAPMTQPRVPLLVFQCVNEIERRGLKERGIYRVPGGERMVKELREKCINGKGSLMLSKVDDIHVVCGLLKDFLRKLKEPLVTFRLHRTFIQAAEIPDEDNGAAIMYQTVGELPKANRDTLAFLMLHLQKVMRSPHCQMDKNNLARVFGPTIVGHGMAEPPPRTILRDTNTQPKVICRMLSLPEEYWKRLLQKGQVFSTVDGNDGQDRIPVQPTFLVSSRKLFKPVTSPELSEFYKSANALSNKGKVDLGKKFFTCPS